MTVADTAQRAAHRGEGELVAGARAGDKAAIRELIRQLNPRLFRVARGIVESDAEAEEVVQEAYLAAFTRLDTFRGEARFSTWVTRIALNAAVMRKRRARPHESYDTVIETAPDSDGVVPFPMTEIERPEAAMARREVRDMLEAGIAALPAPLRLVFLMREVEGMEVRAIAQDLDLNPITVKTRLFRARRRMKEFMQAELAGGFSSIFPFDGARCHALTERTLERLAALGALKP